LAGEVALADLRADGGGDSHAAPVLSAGGLLRALPAGGEINRRASDGAQRSCEQLSLRGVPVSAPPPTTRKPAKAPRLSSSPVPWTLARESTKSDNALFWPSSRGRSGLRKTTRNGIDDPMELTDWAPLDQSQLRLQQTPPEQGAVYSLIIRM
jgi:hypothetical protein